MVLENNNILKKSDTHFVHLSTTTINLDVLFRIAPSALRIIRWSSTQESINFSEVAVCGGDGDETSFLDLVLRV